MKFLKLGIVAASLCFAIEASSGWYEKGNGGDILVCEDGVNLMYDYYEAQARHGLQVHIPPGIESVNVKDNSGFEDLPEIMRVAGLILDRVRVHDVSFAADLHERLRRFPREVAFFSGVELADVEDFGIGYMPRSCTLKQLILQRSPRYSTDPRYIIALDYWKTLSLSQKAVGVVHEILYNYALDINPKIYSSEPVRYFNALLLSDQIRALGNEEYRSIKRSVFLTIMERIE